MNDTNIYKKLSAIQTSLVVPKNQFNKFGGYKYRSCEDILEALKPLLKEHELTIQIQDEIVLVGDRYYVKATATLYDEDKHISSSAFAREAITKKGMDESQITGATSSYARKYALNGMFCIDDTKDADTLNRHEKTNGKKDEVEIITSVQAKGLIEVAKNNGYDKKSFNDELDILGYKDVNDLNQWDYETLLEQFSKPKQKEV